MPRFLIEVPHSSEHVTCVRAIRALLSAGSHYVTHADWGCLDGVHKAWLMVEVDSRHDALCIVPPAFRSDTTVIELTQFSLQEAKEMLREYSGKESL